MTYRWCFLCLLTVCGACVDTGNERLSFPIHVSGTEPSAFFLGRDDWQIQLDQAQLAFGPLYFCAGVQAGELCETARAQWLSSTAVDALNSAEVEVGEAEALSGTLRSFMYDLGFTSLLTQSEPLVSTAAHQLGGYSLRIAGTASRENSSIAFETNLVIKQEQGTEQGVSVVRSQAGDGFEHALSDGARLLVRFDPQSWLAQVDFTSVAAAQGCEHSECEAVVFAADSQAARAIRTSVIAGQRPEFVFEYEGEQ